MFNTFFNGAYRCASGRNEMRFPEWFRDVSIQRKFIFITFLATGGAMVFAILFSTLMQWFLLREDLMQSVSAQASIIAANSVEAIVSNDHEKAKNIAKALENIDSIQFAGILDKTGKNFALYVRPGLAILPHQHQEVTSEHHIHTASYIEVVVPIVLEHEQIGLIHVRSSMAPVYEKLGWNVLITLSAAAGAFLVAVIMILRLLPAITNPLHSLIGLMKRVSRDNNFTLRSELYGSDEMGTLAAGFNTMLEHIQQYDNELMQYREQLKEEVAKRTQQLLEAQEELVRKEKLSVLGQVAGSVGHELRNPLGVMSNAVYFLQTVLPDADESVKEYLEIIKSEIAGSERIVSDLLDSVRTKPPQTEAVGVAELIEQTLHKLNIPSSVTLKLDIPETLPPLRVDPQQIHQVFRNLISNGIEAMQEGGMLEIRAVADEASKQITLSVRDSGIGMTPKQMGKLFQPLFTTKTRGIGLGLVVVKNLTEANGGSVAVQSTPGKGSTFSVTLPAVALAEGGA
jgi:signal transduction histidine kinase